MESAILGVKRVSKGVIVTIRKPILPKFGVGFETYVSYIPDCSEELYSRLLDNVSFECAHSRPYKGYVNIYLDKLKKG